MRFVVGFVALGLVFSGAASAAVLLVLASVLIWHAARLRVTR